MRLPPILLIAVTAVGFPSALADTLQVDIDTGQINWVNASGASMDVAAYSIRSGGNRLNASNWLSISSNYDSDSGSAVDPDDRWTIFGGAMNNLSEGTIGEATLVAAQRIDLGAGAWSTGSLRDLQFEYMTAGNQVVGGTVEYASFSLLGGDFDLDLDVDGDDFLIWQSGFGTTSSALHSQGDADYDRDIDGDDFLIWQSQFVASAGSASAAVTAVPEPSTIAMTFLVGGLLGIRSRGSLRRLAIGPFGSAESVD